jgi:hypothetical protein
MLCGVHGFHSCTAVGTLCRTNTAHRILSYQ